MKNLEEETFVSKGHVIALLLIQFASCIGYEALEHGFGLHCSQNT